MVLIAPHTRSLYRAINNRSSPGLEVLRAHIWPPKIWRALTADTLSHPILLRKYLLYVLLSLPAKIKLRKTPYKKRKSFTEFQRVKFTFWLSRIGFLRLLEEGEEDKEEVKWQMCPPLSTINPATLNLGVGNFSNPRGSIAMQSSPLLFGTAFLGSTVRVTASDCSITKQAPAPPPEREKKVKSNAAFPTLII